MSKKTNPRNIPRTQADCDRAWKEGCIEGIRIMEAIGANLRRGATRSRGRLRREAAQKTWERRKMKNGEKVRNDAAASDPAR